VDVVGLGIDGRRLPPNRPLSLPEGFRVGAALAEAATAARAPPADTLDAVKAVCKDVWPAAYGRGVDSLRTNHRGTYVLRDSSFPRLAPLAGGAGTAADAASALRVQAGLVAGALAALGVDAAVTADAPAPPAADFTVVVRRGVGGEGAGTTGGGGVGGG
jgi:hypothetical protein